MPQLEEEEEKKEIRQVIDEDSFDTYLRTGRLYLMNNAPFFGALLYGTKVTLVPDDEKPPSCAWTDGDEIFFNITQLNDLLVSTLDLEENKKERTVLFESINFLIIHELAHCFFIHLARKGEREPMVWNLACDVSINNLIKDWFPSLNPPNGLLLGNELGIRYSQQKSSENIYDELIKNATKVKVSCGVGKVSNKQGEAGEMIPDMKEDPNKDAQEQKDNWGRKIEEAKAHSGGEMTPRTAGSGSVKVEELLDSLYEPKVNWRTIIDNLGGEIARGDFTFQRRSKTSIITDYYLPSLRTYEPFVVVAVDTSGSISTEEYKRFMSEVRGILGMHNCSVGIIQCDDAVCGYDELEVGDILPTLRRGRGGTTFNPVFEFTANKISRKIDALLYFTDGYNGDRGFEKKLYVDYPVVWVMTTDHMAPKIGATMRYDPYT